MQVFFSVLTSKLRKSFTNEERAALLLQMRYGAMMSSRQMKVVSRLAPDLVSAKFFLQAKLKSGGEVSMVTYACVGNVRLKNFFVSLSGFQ